jgi:hypothetical protein
MPKIKQDVGSDLLDAERVYFRDSLRESRYGALADAEGFQQMCIAIEALGKRLTPNAQGLSDCQPRLKLLAKQSGLLGDEEVIESCGKRFDALFSALREARNDVAHTGAYARHVAADAVVLCLVFEEALMSKRLTVGDFMVSKPVCVEPWQTVGYARQLMLSISFSYLPIWHMQSWWLLSDMAVASYLRPTWPSDEKKKLKIEAAYAEGLTLKEVGPCKPNDLVTKLLQDSPAAGLWLVTGDDYPVGHLVGVLSPFELM